MADEKKTYEPEKHLIDIKGKSYLPVAQRLVWFREEHPDWSIETSVSDRGDGWALMKAKIMDENGRVLTTSHKSETKQGFNDYLEKAETGAIGRALALLGYGTQFAPELEEGNDRIVDAPVEQKTPPQNPFDRASTKQLNMIRALINNVEQAKVGANASNLQEKCDARMENLKKYYGVSSTTKLTKKQASEIIEYLQKEEEE